MKRVVGRGVRPGAWALCGVLFAILAFGAAQVQGQVLGRMELEEIPEEERAPVVVTDPDKALLVVESELADLSFTSNRGILEVRREGAGRYQLVLEPGTHLLTIQAEGFQDIGNARIYLPPKSARFRSVVVASGPSGGRGSLRIETTPSGANVVFNGIELPRITPLELEDQPAGEHQLRLRMPGYAVLDTTVRVLAGEDRELSYRLRRARASLTATSDPSGADVYMGEELIGQTPLDRDDLPPGEYTLSFRLEGHRENRQPVRLRTGERSTVSAYLIPERSLVIFRPSPSDANVYFDGALVRRDKNGDLTVPNPDPGRHQVLARAGGHADLRREVAVQRGDTLEVALELEGSTGGLYVFSTPAGASLELDGARTGRRTPARLDGLNEGMHELALRLRGYLPVDSLVRVHPGRTTTLDVRLRELRGEGPLVSGAGAPGAEGRSRGAAFLRSMFLPGGGQRYMGRKARGAWITGLQVASLAAWAVLYASYQQEADEYHRLQDEYESLETNDPDRGVVQDQWIESWESANDLAVFANGALIAAGAVYTFNLVDILAFGGGTPVSEEK